MKRSETSEKVLLLLLLTQFMTALLVCLCMTRVKGDECKACASADPTDRKGVSGGLRFVERRRGKATSQGCTSRIQVQEAIQAALALNSVDERYASEKN